MYRINQFIRLYQQRNAPSCSIIVCVSFAEVLGQGQTTDIGAHLHLTKWNYNQSFKDGTRHFTMMTQMHANADIEFNIHAVELREANILRVLIFHPEQTFETFSSKIVLAVFFSANSLNSDGTRLDFFGCALQSASFCAKKNS